MRKLKYLSLILMLSILMFAQYEIPIENLLTNSGFGVWSQSDAAKGIAALTYDTGSAGGGDIPDVGDAVTGGASGATGKIMSMTIATGTFAGNNATGVIQLGSTTGCFNDDEALAFTDGETAVVNQPDGAVGADQLVKNGAFVHDIDPPNDWTAVNLATLSTEAGGQVGNCLKVLEAGAVSPTAIQGSIPVSEGFIYKLSFWHKDIDTTGDDPKWGVYDESNVGFIKDYTTESAAGAWTEVSYVFEAPVGCGLVRIMLRHFAGAAEADAYYFDEVTLYEITPGCTGADILAFDGWYKGSNPDIYRQHNDGGTLTKDGSFYSLKIVSTTAFNEVAFATGYLTKEEWYQRFVGRTVTFGAWIKAFTANNARINIWDGATTSSSYHSGGGAWEWIELTDTISAAPTGFTVSIQCSAAPNIDGTTIAYVSQPMLSFQSSIGSGNYSPRQHEWVYFEKYVPSNKYDNTTGWSDTAYADLNLEADSDAIIPKGAKAIMVHVKALDSGSGALVDVHIHLRADATIGEFFAQCWGGRTNSVVAHCTGMQPCDSNGDIQVELEASGGNTLDIVEFRYLAVQVTD